MAKHPPKYVTLQANVTATVTFPIDLGKIEILNIDGDDEIWIAFGDGGDVTPMSEGTYVLPSIIGYLTTDPETSGPTIVRLKSSTSQRVGVRGLG